MSTLNVTTDLEEIRKWVEKRNGFPVEIKGVKPEDSIGFLFDETAVKAERHKKLNWDEFSEKLESLLLAFQYEETQDENAAYRFVSKSNN